MKARTFTALVLVVTVGCGSSLPTERFSNEKVQQSAPLGPGYVLLPLGTDDDALLGQMLPLAPSSGQALEVIAALNPCVDKLDAKVSVGMVSTVQDAQELKTSAEGRAALGVYGFQAEAKHATHFVYKLATERKETREAPAAYLQCCREKNCGYGVVTELVYGDGLYVAGEETSGEVGGDILSVASAHGTASLKVLHTRHVHGWIAAKVMLHPSSPTSGAAPAEPPGPIGDATVKLDIDSASAQVKQLYDREKIGFCEVPGGWALCDEKDKVNEVFFAQRYRELLKNDDLKDVEARRNTGWIVLDFALAGGGLFMMGYAFKFLPDPSISGDKPSSAPFYGLTFGGISLLSLGITMMIWNEWGLGFTDNPSVTDHKLTRGDAERIVDRYNRALLRKTTADVEGSRYDVKSSAIHVRPTVGLGGLGLVGSF